MLKELQWQLYMVSGTLKINSAKSFHHEGFMKEGYKGHIRWIWLTEGWHKIIWRSISKLRKVKVGKILFFCFTLTKIIHWGFLIKAENSILIIS